MVVRPTFCVVVCAFFVVRLTSIEWPAAMSNAMSAENKKADHAEAWDRNYGRFLPPVIEFGRVFTSLGKYSKRGRRRGYSAVKFFNCNSIAQ